MRTGGTRTMLPLALAAAVAVIALLAIATVAAIAATRGGRSASAWGMGGWGMMGNGHMQQMMGGGTNTSNETPSVGTKTATVDMRNFAFTPGNLQVPVGATVTFTNDDSVPHTATARDGSWDTGLLNQGESKSITFDKPGDYEYYCKVHPNQVAHLTVR